MKELQNKEIKMTMKMQSELMTQGSLLILNVLLVVINQVPYRLFNFALKVVTSG